MKVKQPFSYKSGVRDTNDVSQGVRNVVDQVNVLAGGINERLDALQLPASPPIDEYTHLWWPCIDRVEQPNSTNLTNRTNAGVGTLIPTAGADTRSNMTPGGPGYARTTSTTGEFSGASGMFPSSTQVSMSFWAKPGGFTGVNRFLFGHWNAGGNGIFSIFIDNTGRISGLINRTVGGALIVPTTDDLVPICDWTLYWMRFNGTQLDVGMNTEYTSSAAFASTTINWAFGAAPRVWKIGFPANASYVHIRDIRVHSRLLPDSWIDDAYTRWNRFGDRT